MGIADFTSQRLRLSVVAMLVLFASAVIYTAVTQFRSISVHEDQAVVQDEDEQSGVFPPMFGAAINNALAMISTNVSGTQETGSYAPLTGSSLDTHSTNTSSTSSDVSSLKGPLLAALPSALSVFNDGTNDNSRITTVDGRVYVVRRSQGVDQYISVEWSDRGVTGQYTWKSTPSDINAIPILGSHVTKGGATIWSPPAIAVDNSGRMHVVAMSKSGSHIFWYTSCKRTANEDCTLVSHWSNPIKIAETASGDGYPVMASHGDRLHLALWDRQHGDVQYIRYYQCSIVDGPCASFAPQKKSELFDRDIKVMRMVVEQAGRALVIAVDDEGGMNVFYPEVRGESAITTYKNIYPSLPAHTFGSIGTTVDVKNRLWMSWGEKESQFRPYLGYCNILDHTLECSTGAPGSIGAPIAPTSGRGTAESPWGQYSALATDISGRMILLYNNPRDAKVWKVECTIQDGHTCTTAEEWRTEGASGVSCEGPSGALITDISVEDIRAKTVRVQWSTSDDATGFVYVDSGNAATAAPMGSAQTYARSHSIQLDALAPRTRYYFSILATNKCGMISRSARKAFMTSEYTNEDEARDSLRAYLLSEASRRKDEVLKMMSALAPVTQQLVKSFVSGLSGVSSAEQSSALRIAQEEFKKPTVLLDVEPDISLADTSATIRWTSPTKTTSLIAYASESEYKPEQPFVYSKQAGDKLAYTTAHEVVLTDLRPFTTYHYQIIGEAEDGAGVMGIHRTFGTLPVQPIFTEIKIDEVTEYSALVTWQTNIPTNTSITVQEYDTGVERIIVDPSYVQIHRNKITNLKEKTKYTVSVAAQTERGEEVRSQPETFQTSPDGEKPEISTVRTKLSLASGSKESVQAVISWATNEVASSIVEYAEGARLSGPSVEQSPIVEDQTTNHVVVISRLRPATIYTFQAVSIDQAGNRGQSKQFKIFTPRKEESVLELILKNFEASFGFLKGI